NIKHQAASLVDVGCSSLGETEDILPLAQLYGDVMWTQEKFGEVAFAEAHRRSRKLM
ncbi:unnamed protein product, partial [Ascophyllum nodosum]